MELAKNRVINHGALTSLSERYYRYCNEPIEQNCNHLASADRCSQTIHGKYQHS